MVQHPLQPFDARNLVAGPRTRPFSFDQAALAGAEAARRPRAAVTRLVTEPLPARPQQDVALADLQAFLAHPARAFLRSRLDVTSPLEAEETHDAIPLTLDGLEKWAIGDRMLAEVLAGSSPPDVVRSERPARPAPTRAARGPCPAGDQGPPDRADPRARCRCGRATRGSLDVDIDLGGGRRLTGTVGSLWGNKLVTASYSRLAAKHRLRAWLDLLALSVGHPDENWTAHTVGRSGRNTARRAGRSARPPRGAVAA